MSAPIKLPNKKRLDFFVVGFASGFFFGVAVCCIIIQFS